MFRFGVRDVYDPGPILTYDARDTALARAGRAGTQSFFDASTLPHAGMGWFGSDLLDDVEDVVGSALDAVSDVTDKLKDIPGISQVWGLVNDFAQTGVGRAFLDYAAPMLVPALWAVPFVGPVIAPIAYALPGIARGERADVAFVSEMSAIASQVGEQVFKEQVPVAVDAAKTLLDNQGAAYLAKLTPTQLAQIQGAFHVPPIAIREDIAQRATDGVLGRAPAENFDIKTGKWVPRVKVENYGGVSAGTLADWITNKPAPVAAGGAAPSTAIALAPGSSVKAAGLTRGQKVSVLAGVVGVLGVGAIIAKKKGLI